MPTPASCPQCGARYNAKDELLLHDISCPSCKNVVRLQPLEAKPATSPPAAKPEKQQSWSGDEPDTTTIADELEDEVDDDTFSFGEREQRTEDGDMDMTPMVDVTFLLLIFFMITAAFSLQKAFDQPLPDNDQPSSAPVDLEDIEQDSDYITVHVTAYNSYEIITSDWELTGEDELASKHDLLMKMREAAEGNAEGVEPTKLLVRANSQAFYDTVVAALDCGAAVGMSEVQLVTIDEDGE